MDHDDEYGNWSLPEEQIRHPAKDRVSRAQPEHVEEGHLVEVGLLVLAGILVGRARYGAARKARSARRRR